MKNKIISVASSVITALVINSAAIACNDEKHYELEAWVYATLNSNGYKKDGDLYEKEITGQYPSKYFDTDNMMYIDSINVYSTQATTRTKLKEAIQFWNSQFSGKPVFGLEDTPDAIQVITEKIMPFENIPDKIGSGCPMSDVLHATIEHYETTEVVGIATSKSVHLKPGTGVQELIHELGHYLGGIHHDKTGIMAATIQALTNTIPDELKQRLRQRGYNPK